MKCICKNLGQKELIPAQYCQLRFYNIEIDNGKVSQWLGLMAPILAELSTLAYEGRLFLCMTIEIFSMEKEIDRTPG